MIALHLKTALDHFAYLKFMTGYEMVQAASSA
jgi:hypothetical protein